MRATFQHPDHVNVDCVLSSFGNNIAKVGRERRLTYSVSFLAECDAFPILRRMFLMHTKKTGCNPCRTRGHWRWETCRLRTVGPTCARSTLRRLENRSVLDSTKQGELLYKFWLISLYMWLMTLLQSFMWQKFSQIEGNGQQFSHIAQRNSVSVEFSKSMPFSAKCFEKKQEFNNIFPPRLPTWRWWFRHWLLTPSPVVTSPCPRVGQPSWSAGLQAFPGMAHQSVPEGGSAKLVCRATGFPR